MPHFKWVFVPAPLTLRDWHRRSGRDLSPDSCTLLAFQRNAEQWLVAGLLSHSLEIVEVLLGCWWGDHGDKSHMVPSPHVDVPFPRSGVFVVFNWLESLRPKFSLRFIDDNEPYPVVLRKIFQGSCNRVSLHAPTGLGRCEKPILLGLNYLDLLAEPPAVTTTHGRVNDRGNEARRNCQRHFGWCHRHQDTIPYPPGLRASPLQPVPHELKLRLGAVPCDLQGLSCTVNPILTFKRGIVRMALTEPGREVFWRDSRSSR